MEACILDILRNGGMRPSHIHRILGEVAVRVMDVQLKEMVGDGLLEKRVFHDEPRPHTEYWITELGLSLLLIVDAMTQWGENHRELLECKFEIDINVIRP